jgi:hypothetical protein
MVEMFARADRWCSMSAARRPELPVKPSEAAGNAFDNGGSDAVHQHREEQRGVHLRGVGDGEAKPASGFAPSDLPIAK